MLTRAAVVLALWTGVGQALTAAPVQAPVTPDDVMAMIRKIPAMCPGGHPCADRPGNFDLTPAALKIATGIAEAASEETQTVLGSVRDDAALLAVDAAYESGMRPLASGDHGRSLGPWQMQGSRAGVACDPKLGAREWLRRAREAMRTCVERPYEERLSLLASGYCDHGTVISRDRVTLAQRIAKEAP